MQQICPVTSLLCPFDPACAVGRDNSGNTYCANWVKKHQIIGIRIKTKPDLPEDCVAIIEDMMNGKPFYFIYNRDKNKVKEFGENKQGAINYCVERRLKWQIIPIQL